MKFYLGFEGFWRQRDPCSVWVLGPPRRAHLRVPLCVRSACPLRCKPDDGGSRSPYAVGTLVVRAACLRVPHYLVVSGGRVPASGASWRCSAARWTAVRWAPPGRDVAGGCLAADLVSAGELERISSAAVIEAA